MALTGGFVQWAQGQHQQGAWHLQVGGIAEITGSQQSTKTNVNCEVAGPEEKALGDIGRRSHLLMDLDLWDGNHQPKGLDSPSSAAQEPRGESLSTKPQPALL